MMAKQQRIIDRHLLEKVFKIYHTGETEVDRAKMSNVIVALVDIIDRVPNIYNTDEGCVVKKMIL
jgi:hypothetical protein